MRRIDRYVAKEMLLPFLFGISAFTSLFVSSDLLRLAELVVDSGAPVEAALRVFLLQLPQVVVWTLPMSVLLATLLALSRLSATSEIVAMRAGGVSFGRLVAPVLIIAALVSLGAFGLNELVVPYTNERAERVMIEEIRGRSLPTTQDNVVIRGQEGPNRTWLLFARRFDARTQTMNDLVMVRMERNRPIETTSAVRAIWDGDSWFTEETVSHHYVGDDRVVTLTYPEGRQPFQLAQTPQQIAQRRKEPEQMSLSELRDHVATLRDQGVDVRSLEVQMHLKYSLPLASLAFALIAAPLGIQSHRSATSIGFGLSVILIFVYYTLMTLGTALGQAGTLPAAVAAWVQNITIGGTGVFLMIRQGG